MCCVVLRKQWTRVRGCRPSTNTPACLVQRVNVSVDLGICRDIGSNYGTDGLYFGMKCVNTRVTAAWTQSCVTRRQQCSSDTVLWHGTRQHNVWKAALWLVENMLTRRWHQSIFRYAESAILYYRDHAQWPMAHTLGLGLGKAEWVGLVARR